MAQDLTFHLTNEDEADFAVFNLTPMQGFIQYVEAVKRNAIQQRFELAKVNFVQVPQDKQVEILKAFADSVNAEVAKLPAKISPKVP